MFLKDNRHKNDVRHKKTWFSGVIAAVAGASLMVSSACGIFSTTYKVGKGTVTTTYKVTKGVVKTTIGALTDCILPSKHQFLSVKHSEWWLRD